MLGLKSEHVCTAGLTGGRYPPCRVGFIYAVALTFRMRYYFAWAVSESSLIFSGLCFNGYDDSTGCAK